jgi:hypothetical protein
MTELPAPKRAFTDSLAFVKSFFYSLYGKGIGFFDRGNIALFFKHANFIKNIVPYLFF